MTDNSHAKHGPALERFTGRRDTSAGARAPVSIDETSFPAEFARLRASVIRPVFEAVGNTLKERGDEFTVSEEDRRISIHIVPVLFGSGIRLFEHLGSEHVQLETIEVTETKEAIHLRFRVIK